MMRRHISGLGIFLCAASMSFGEVHQNAQRPHASIVSDLTLADSTGTSHTPLTDRGQKATVLVFLMHDCPVTNTTAPELNRLFTEFAKRGVDFFRIYTTETAEDIAQHGRDFGFVFPGLRDPALHLARLAGATRAPEAVVVSSSGELLYRGRIDDRAVKPGVTRPTARRRDLALALEAVLEVGCYLPIDEPAQAPGDSSAANPPTNGSP